MILFTKEVLVWNQNLRSGTDIRTADTHFFNDPAIAVAALGTGLRDPVGVALFVVSYQIQSKACGHATLASAFVVLNYYEPESSVIQFSTLSGLLTVERSGEAVLAAVSEIVAEEKNT